MKIQTKRRGRILSARKSIIEQTKMRQGFERRLYKQMVSYFNSTGRQASREIQSGRVELKGLEERLSQVLLPHYRSVIESFANRFVFTKQENQWERIIRNYITTQGGAKITRISGTTRTKINKIISDGQVEGFGVDKIAKNIRTQMSEPFTRYRSALIARTETHNASSYTNQAVAESYEVPMKKRWVSTNDDRTRSHHSAMNGVEVDLEADFDVPYKGVTYKMKHAGDPRGGPANVINCRCVILYVEPDDFVIDEDTPVEEPVQPSQPVGDINRDRSVSPRDASVTFGSINLLSRNVAVSRLDDDLAKANTREGYFNVDTGHFNSANPQTFGKVALAQNFTEESLSTIVALKPELDALTEKFGVAKIRSIDGRKIRNYNMAMGDGVLYINPDYINGLTQNMKVGTVAERLSEPKRRRLNELNEEIVSVRNEMSLLFAPHQTPKYKFKKSWHGSPESRKYYDDLEPKLNKLRDERKALLPFKSSEYSTDQVPVYRWGRGDKITDRPWTVKYYFDNDLDRLRSTFYHEIGHQIHQLYKRKHTASGTTNPLERNMDSNYWSMEQPLEDLLSDYRRRRKAKKGGGATEYSDTEGVEWFAENFSLYYLDKKDLVDPVFIDLIENLEERITDYL